MRIVRFRTKSNRVSFGILKEETITLIDGGILGRLKKAKETVFLNDVKLLAPIIPPNLLALGMNYSDHAKEGGVSLPKAPVLFIKTTTTITDPDSDVLLPKMAPNNVDYEAELAIIIGKTAKHVSEAKAHEYVLGYTCANDVSARDCQGGDLQWARGKCFDTFAPLGPWIETELDPDKCNIILRLNGKTMQNADTSQLIFNTRFIISYLSDCMTLLPGTVILTGTPSGVGFARKPPVWLKEGDIMEVEIEGIGILKNKVVKE
jgi:2-keto-4-pentenoate hydratase/2-oxohepta-3-ene-1,7-dioic acid hydratase in catechol pathway